MIVDVVDVHGHAHISDLWTSTQPRQLASVDVRAYRLRMTQSDRHATPRRPIGIPNDEWDDLGKLVGERNRSEVVRQFVRALLRRPGVRMPKPTDFKP